VRSLADIDVEDYNRVEATIITLIKEAFPRLDLRRGTALRDLLVTPASAVRAHAELEIEDLQASMSLALLAANPELDPTMVDKILSNLELTRRQGSSGGGIAAFGVATPVTITIPAGYTVVSPTGTEFSVSEDLKVSPDPQDGEATLLTAPAGSPSPYYFIAAIRATTAGSEGNLSKDTALTITGPAFTGLSREVWAYQDFTGGSNEETLDELLGRLSQSVGRRALDTPQGISATLLNEFSEVTAVSTVGHGDTGMLRDRNNLLQASVGGHVDVYLHIGRGAPVTVVQVTGQLVADGSYIFSIEPSVAPGMKGVRAVYVAGNQEAEVSGSFPFTLEWSPQNFSASGHSAGSLEPVVAAAYTRYRGVTGLVTDVPSMLVAGRSTWPETLDLAVEVYAETALVPIQEFVDRSSVGDYLAKAAVPCHVAIRATLIRDAEVAIDLAAAKQLVVDYVNSTSFGDSVAASRLSEVLHAGLDIKRVESVQLEGTVISATNETVHSAAAVLGAEQFAGGPVSGQLTAKTMVFVTRADQVYLEVRVG